MSAIVLARATMARSGVRFAQRLPCALANQLRFYASYPPHTVIDMPALSPTMTQGNLASWAKKVGDKLEPGDVLAEVETDKASMDFEFQEEGYLAKILVEDGTKDIPVGKPIGVYVDKAEDVPAFADFTVEDAGGSAPAPTPAAETPKEEPKATPAAAAPPKEESKPAASAKSATKPPVGRIFASPLAKTIALERGISLKDVKGTGPNGRITKKDVEAYTPPAAAPAKATGSAPAASASYEDIPVSNMRKTIAARLTQSKNTAPDYIVSSTCSVSKLLKLRAALNASADGEYKISVNDILVKAIAIAAKKVPAVNSHWIESEGVIRQFKNVDVSIAVATPTGLITPIVKNVESKGLAEVSKAAKELGKKARDGKLAPEEYQGGTITISNMGMNPAVSMFSAIVNPPQSTIVAVGTVEKRAIPDEESEAGFAFDDTITLTSSFDHKVVDGAVGAEFMLALKKVVENPLELML